MEKDSLQSDREEALKDSINNRKVLLIGPGKSSETEKDKIIDFVNKNKVIVISTNFDYKYLQSDYIFISNIRRFKELNEKSKARCIATSNIPYDGIYYQTDYKQLLNNVESVSDNAGLMAIKLLILFGAKKVFLAGFDGYSHEKKENYFDENMTLVAKNAILDNTNQGMCKVLAEYSKKIEIDFLTTKKHLKIGE